LGKADLIASLEDYVANATADLLMFAAWNAASCSVGGEPIPTYCFARDDRVYFQFVQRCQKHRSAINRKCTKRLKWQLSVLEEGLSGRNVMFRSKIDLLRTELDQGNGP